MATPPKWKWTQSGKIAEQTRYESDLARENQAAYLQAMTSARIAEAKGMDELRDQWLMEAFKKSHPEADPALLLARGKAAAYHATMTSNEANAARNEGLAKTGYQQGLTEGQAFVTDNIARQAENIAREAEASEMSASGVAATKAENIARQKRAGFQGQAADSGIEELNKLTGPRIEAESGRLSNVIRSSAGAAPYSGVLGASTAKQGIAQADLGVDKSRFEQKVLGAQDPNLAGQAANANNSLLSTTANLIEKNPSINPNISIPKGPMGGVDATTINAINTINKLLQEKKKAAAPVPAPGVNPTIIDRGTF